MRSYALLTLVSVQLLSAVEVMAQSAEPYDLIPGDAAIVVRLQAPDQTIEEVANFVDKVQPGIGGVVRGQAAAIGMAIKNPTLGGVDRAKDWYLVSFADANDRPEIVMLIPATDAAALKKAVGDRFQFAEKDDWVAYSTKAELIDQMKACFGGDVSPISGQMDEHVRKELTSGHLTVFVNADSLKQTYATQLAEAEDRLDELIEAMGAQIRKGNAALDITYILDVYRSLGRSLIQGVRDSNSLVVSVRVTDGALQIEELLTVNEGSQCDTFLKGQPVSDMSRLKSVPQGLAAYVAMSGDPQPLMDWVGELFESTIKDEEIRKKFMNSVAIMREVQFGTIVGGGDIVADDDAAAIRYFGLAEVNPTSMIRESFLQFTSPTEYEFSGIKQKVSYEPAAETIADQSIDLYRFQQTMPPELDPTGMQKALNDRLYGPEGMTQRLAFKAGLLLQTMGGGPDSMKQLLAPETWSDVRLLQARDHQHETANLLLLVDIPNTVLKFAKLVIGTETLPIPIQAEQLDALQLAPSYAGFSVAAESQRLRARTTLPVETFQGLVQLGAFVRGLIAAGR